jgi:hypothetical protein
MEYTESGLTPQLKTYNLWSTDSDTDITT